MVYALVIIMIYQIKYIVIKCRYIVIKFLLFILHIVKIFTLEMLKPLNFSARPGP